MSDVTCNQSDVAGVAGVTVSAAPDVPVIAILKRHLETSVHYQQVASKIGNPEGFAYVKIPDWEVRQIIEHLERQNDPSSPTRPTGGLHPK
jgi:hypothetical protein